MELVEGRTLASAIPAGGLPLEELLAIAVPLADALASAHAKGVIHRDLKPANVMLDGEGRVKVLDFGLAKLAETVDSSSETLTSDGVTRAGHLLGTVAYMSPEQAEGLAVDPRSDLFSFGILLYQMATGRNPFQRGHTVSTLAAILKDTPPPVAPERGPLPKELVEIVGRCLEKSPDRRYASAAELRDRLRGLQAALHATLSSGSFAGAAPASAIGLLRRPRVAIPLALVLLGTVALGFWLVLRSRRAAWAREVALPEIEKLLDASPGASGPGSGRRIFSAAKRSGSSPATRCSSASKSATRGRSVSTATRREPRSPRGRTADPTRTGRCWVERRSRSGASSRASSRCGSKRRASNRWTMCSGRSRIAERPPATECCQRGRRAPRGHPGHRGRASRA